MSQGEKPFLDQLADLGWRVVTGNVELPSATGRGSWRRVERAMPDYERRKQWLARRGGAHLAL